MPVYSLGIVLTSVESYGGKSLKIVMQRKENAVTYRRCGIKYGALLCVPSREEEYVPLVRGENGVSFVKREKLRRRGLSESTSMETVREDSQRNCNALCLATALPVRTSERYG